MPRFSFAALLWVLVRSLMPGRKHGKSIKNSRVYEALKKKGYSKTKAARISNSKRKRRGR